MRGYTPIPDLPPPEATGALRPIMSWHWKQIRRSRGEQAIFFWGGAFHRIDVCSRRGCCWLHERAEHLVGVYTRAASLEQLVEDAHAVLAEVEEAA